MLRGSVFSSVVQLLLNRQGRAGRAALAGRTAPGPSALPVGTTFDRRTGEQMVLAVRFCSFYFAAVPLGTHWPPLFVKKKLESGHVLWEFPHHEDIDRG